MNHGIIHRVRLRETETVMMYGLDVQVLLLFCSFYPGTHFAWIWGHGVGINNCCSH